MILSFLNLMPFTFFHDFTWINNVFFFLINLCLFLFLDLYLFNCDLLSMVLRFLNLLRLFLFQFGGRLVNLLNNDFV